MNQFRISKNSERGILTLDLMFAMVLVTALSTVLFAMMFTLSLTSVAQYISFASARSYSAAHFSKDEQVGMAEQTFLALVENPEISHLMRGSFFELEDPRVEDFNDQYEPSHPNGFVFHGVRIGVLSKMLNFRVPIFGSTSTSDRGFRADVNSYLLRDPSEMECRKFFENRYEKIISRVSGGGGATMSPDETRDNVVFDNGC